ncbi:ABC transporter substrate-binding protein [Nocardia jinanensis]|uniref:Solute-binding protein family 5 domain-containing protein n=1 Tax=Nocardia jinanensis TaxID=382504 RepID=A0A917RAU4_9NOCA|nr:ABC transporter substrate-binding protein [Nocardia jinanensis]GGK99039.1 hypothetical protein GCM10011588_12070 [Nocardia jinanensis]
MTGSRGPGRTGSRPARTAELCAAVLTCLTLVAGCGRAQVTATDAELVIAVPTISATADTQNLSSGLTAINGLVQYTRGLLEFAPLASDATGFGSLTDAFSSSLASSVRLTAEGPVFTLADVRAPSGNRLSPDDVVYTYKRNLALKDGIGKSLLLQAGVDLGNPVTVLGPDEVRVNATNRLYGLPVSFYTLAILDSRTVQEHATAADPWAQTWMSTHSATYAPYQVSEFRPGQRLALTANPNWPVTPPYSRLTLVPSAAPAQLVGTSSVDAGYWLPTAQAHLLADQQRASVDSVPTLSQDLLSLDQSFPPFADERVRQAMSLTIDRAALLRGPYFGFGSPSRGHITTSLPVMDGFTGAHVTYDLAQAKALMAASGFPDGFAMNLTINAGTSRSVDVQSVAVALKSMLADVGIDVTIQNVANPAEFKSGRTGRSYHAYLWSTGPTIPDAVYGLDNAYASDGGANYVKAADAPLDADLAEAVAAATGSAEQDAAAQAALTRLDELMPSIPLVDTDDVYATTPGICGIAPSARGTVDAATLTPCT